MVRLSGENRVAHKVVHWDWVRDGHSFGLYCGWGMVRVRDPTQRLDLTFLKARGNVQAFVQLVQISC